MPTHFTAFLKRWAGQPAGAALFFTAFYSCLFAPALFTGKVLAASGDVALFYYPHYEAPVRLWNSFLMTGFPDAADPQLMTWYPLALVLRAVPGSWNAFVLLACILASWFMYLFVRSVTRSGFSGLIGGLIFGLCGFMSAHLGHITMRQAALWIPAILFCLERLAEELRWRWVILGALCTASCVLAGHPQIALYGLALVCGYAVVRGLAAISPKGRYYAASAVTIIAGAGLSAIQTLPTAETAGLSTRARMSFAEFSQYSLPPHQLASVLFPYLFGGVGPVFPGGIPYFGAGSITGVAGFVGLSGLVLAAIALLSRPASLVLFWISAMALSLLASMGDATPLGRLLYMLPGFGQFRAQGRFLFAFGTAAAVLAGYGLSAIREKHFRRRNTIVVALGAMGLVVVAVTIATLWAAPLERASKAAGIHGYSASALRNGWLGWSLWAGLAAAVVMLAMIRKPDAAWIRGVFVVAVIAEMAPFSWYAEWKFASHNVADFAPPAIVRRASETLRREQARWVPVSGELGSLAEAPGDLPLLWNLPSVSKYGPLLPSRYKALLHMEVNGRLEGPWWEPANRALDLTGGRFFATPDVSGSPSAQYQGAKLLAQDLTLSVGHGCGAPASSAVIHLPHTEEVSAVALVSLLGCSAGLEQGAPVAEVHLADSNGSGTAIPIRAGMETAEWAAGCADVAPTMRHHTPVRYGHFEVSRAGRVCQGQNYAVIIHLDHVATVSSLTLDWLPPGEGALKIEKLSLLDSTGGSNPIAQQDVWFGDPERWKPVDKGDGVAVFENLHALPRVWLVPKTITASPDQVLRAIQTSRLPDGGRYDPAAVALVEEPLEFENVSADARAQAILTHDDGSSVEIRASSPVPGFLVLGDYFYPGWQATVNGQPAHIYRTNYIQRGLPLPAGESHVRFEFHSAPLHAGAAITLGMLALLSGAAVFGLRSGRW